MADFGLLDIYFLIQKKLDVFKTEDLLNVTEKMIDDMWLCLDDMEKV